MKFLRPLTAALMLALVAPAFAQAAPQDIPRTLEGHPDFHGMWTSRWLTPVERIPDADTLVVSEEEGKRLARVILDRAARPTQMDPELAFPDADSLAVVRGEYRTSLITSPENGKLPFSDEGRKAMGGYITGLDGPEQRMTTERCLGGVGWAPLQIRTASMLRRFIQTDDHLIIHSEAYDDLRLIGIDDNPLPDAVKPPGGDSVAQWEGDTLVVETTNLTPRLSTHGIVTVLSPDARIVERFEYASPDELVYQYTVHDPAYYSEPWTAEYSLLRSDEDIYEYACHAGNYALPHMLAGARQEERAERRK